MPSAHSHAHPPTQLQAAPPHIPPPYASQAWASETQFQPAGYLPAPQGWTPGSPTPIVVNQYYLSPAAAPSSNSSHSSGSSCAAFNTIKTSATTAATRVNDALPGSLQIPTTFDDGLPPWHAYGTQLLNQGAALVDQIQSKFNHVMTSIDRNKFEGSDREMAQYGTVPQQVPRSHSEPMVKRSSSQKRSNSLKKDKKALAATSSVIPASFFSKVDYYSNSKLPLDLDPLRL